MTTPVFATLDDVDIRNAWPHEALDFTPWLGTNLDRLGTILGLQLDLVKTEGEVGSFAADIVARDSRDGSIVLIENQLESSDHKHLGQILTYLTGLKATTIAWIAPTFRNEHLSAIRWLNENTLDPYSFFAVKVRVVRIAGSPLAPIFEIVEKPNGWDRRLQEQMAKAQEVLPDTAKCRAFWELYNKLYPESLSDRTGSGATSRWRVLKDSGLVISRWVSGGSVGVFVRGDTGFGGPKIIDRLKPYQIKLEAMLGAKLGHPNFPFEKKLEFDLHDQSQWEHAAEWLHAEVLRYEAALLESFRDDVQFAEKLRARDIADATTESVSENQ